MAPAAFLSYAHLDDEASGGLITRLRERLASAVSVAIGERFEIFQDRDGIAWGQHWPKRLDEALGQAAFLIPILTPAYFKSRTCRAELEQFLELERRTGRQDLILPVYFYSARDISERSDPLAVALSTRQYFDWRHIRHLSLQSPEVNQSLEQLADVIEAAVYRTLPADPGVQPPVTGSGKRSTRVPVVDRSVDLELIAERWRVTRDVVLRAAPALAAPVVTRLPPGAVVHVAGRAKGTSWLLVEEHGESRGYAAEDALEPPPSRAEAVVVARRAAIERNLSRLDDIVAELPEGTEGFLAQTGRLREMVGKICQFQQLLDSEDRPVFRKRLAALLAKEIEHFHRRVGEFHEPLASGFRAAAERWLVVANRQRREADALVAEELTPQVFRAGEPVDRRLEAFILRKAVIGELQRQVMLAAGCPGLLVYGRRRMGKSTVLQNLAGFLPDSVRVAIISMQHPRAFSSLPSFLQFTAERIQGGLSSHDRESPPAALELSAFFDFLDSYNEELERARERLILALDEYRQIDEKIGAKVFSEDLLAMIRESIQSHRQVTWVFAGSHHITELSHAPWPSYLVSVRTVEVPPFSDAETRLLLTDPLRHSPMWERDDSRRPRFDAAFWGEDGIERIHTEAAGWPHLVQLIAETAVDLLNDEDVRRLDGALLERALDRAIARGDLVLRQLMEGECELPSEWDYLRAFRTRDTQPPPDDEAVHRSLRRRLLVTETNGEWRLRVPLMQRWLRERG